jgi:thiamine-monophosphate kinase
MPPRRPRHVTEKDVIESVALFQRQTDPAVETGIGDDCAVLAPNAAPGVRQLVTTDLLVEGVHFDLRYMRRDVVGWKALAVSVSDVASMGGVSRHAVGQLGVPRGTTPAQLARLLSGVEDCAEEYGVTLVGGDTIAAPQWTIGFTVLGESAGPPVLRRGARPGDQLWHAGRLGLSQVGLHLLWGQGQGAPSLGRAPYFKEARQAHTTPLPRAEVGCQLRAWGATAAIDTSDSLAQCLLQLAAASGVGLRLDFRTYMIDPAVAAFAAACRKLAGPMPAGGAFIVPADYTPEGREQVYSSPAQFVLGSAEDYALLFTAPAALAPRLEALPFGLRRLGAVVPATRGCVWLDETGREQPLLPLGWQHL